MTEIKTLVGKPTKKPMIFSIGDLEELPYQRENYDPIKKVIETEKVVKEYNIMEQLLLLQESREVA